LDLTTQSLDLIKMVIKLLSDLMEKLKDLINKDIKLELARMVKKCYMMKMDMKL